MIRIGINALSIIPGAIGGCEIYLSNLLKHLAPLVNPQELYVFVNRNSLPVYQHLQGDKVIIVPVRLDARNRLKRMAYEQLVLPVKAKKLGIGLLFFPTPNCSLLFPGRNVFALQSLHFFLAPHLFSRLKKHTLAVMARLSAKRASRIIAVSHSVRADAIGLIGVPEERIITIHEGVDYDLFHLPDGNGGDRHAFSGLRQRFGIRPPYIFSPSSLYSYKNVGPLKEAFSALYRQHQDLQLVISGSDWLAELANYQQLCRRLGIARNVIFTGSQPHPVMPYLYHNALCTAYPSTLETFGLPILESMAAGTPLLVSKAKSAPEIAAGCAVLVDGANAQSIHEGLQQLMDNPGLRKRLSHAGLERARHFSWQRTARETLSLFRAVAAAGGR